MSLLSLDGGDIFHSAETRAARVITLAERRCASAAIDQQRVLVTRHSQCLRDPDTRKKAQTVVCDHIDLERSSLFALMQEREPSEGDGRRSAAAQLPRIVHD